MKKKVSVREAVQASNAKHGVPEKRSVTPASPPVRADNPIIMYIIQADDDSTLDALIYFSQDKPSQSYLEQIGLNELSRTRQIEVQSYAMPRDFDRQTLTDLGLYLDQAYKG